MNVLVSHVRMGELVKMASMVIHVSAFLVLLELIVKQVGIFLYIDEIFNSAYGPQYEICFCSKM